MTDQPPSPPPPPAGPGYAPPESPAAAAPPPKTSGTAGASLVCGLLGLCTCGLSALVGLILGIVALRQIGRSGGAVAGKGLATAGIVVSAVTLLLGVVLGVGVVGLGYFASGRAVAVRDGFHDYEVRRAFQTAADALERYRMDVGRYPTEAEGGLEALVRRPPAVPERDWHGPYLDAVPVDRWGNPIAYEPPDPDRPDDLEGYTYTLSSAGPDGVPGTPDDIER